MKIAVAFWVMLAGSTVLFAQSNVRHSTPMGLDWQSNHALVPAVPGFRYWYGSIGWGKIIYVGTEDLIKLETELHLYFSGKKIYKAYLMLGPAGINENNCFDKFAKVVKILDSKYGTHNMTTVTKSPEMEELFYFSKCAPVRNGLYGVKKKWLTPSHQITLTFFGEDGEYYLELEYENRDVSPNSINSEKF